MLQESRAERPDETPGQLRRRLFNPQNAVHDDGIDLQRPRRVALEQAEKRRLEVERQNRFEANCLDFFNWQATEIKDVLRRSRPESDPSLRKIIFAVGKHFGVSTRDIKSPRRNPIFARPRHVVYWLARETTMMSLPQIGKNLGGRDHSTIWYGVKKIDLARVSDAKLQADLSELLSALRSTSPENDNAANPTGNGS